MERIAARSTTARATSEDAAYWGRYRAEFPVCQRHAYFMSAAMAPLSRRVHRAVTDAAARLRDEGGLRYADHQRAIEEWRRQAAALIGAQADELAFVPSSSFGINALASSLRPGVTDGVVVSLEDEFPATVMGWRQAGFPVVLLKAQRSTYPLPHVLTQLDSLRASGTRVAAVAASWVQFATGARLDIVGLGQALRERDIPLVLNVTQGVGVLKLDLRAAGAAAAVMTCHKGLLGVEGLAMLFVTGELFAKLRPAFAGWRSALDPMSMKADGGRLREDARVFELGSPNILALHGLGAALSLYEEVGPERIETRVRQLVITLCEGLEDRRLDYLPGEAAEHRSGIVLVVPRQDAASVVERLREQGVLTTCRRGGVRVSMHFFNDESDIERLLAAFDHVKAAD